MRAWEEYIHAVEIGKRNAGRLEKLAIQHVKKLAELYYFDTEEAERVLQLVSLMKYPTGKWKGKYFELMPHQVFFLAYLFGLKNEKDGVRLIREAMFNMAKKGGKSALSAVLGVLFTFFDGEETAEGYVVANKTDQTLFCWKAAKNICLQLRDDHPEEFGGNFKFYDNRQEHILIQPSSENFFKTLPYESNTLDGVNPHIAIVDEFHEYPDTSVPDNLQSGMVLRDQPLLLYSTTRGFHPYGPLAEKEEYYENVLTGLVEDHRVFPLIFSLDDDKDWTKKSYWIQFAPGIDHDLPPAESLAREMKIALEEGGERLVSCKTKNFNIWQRSKSAFAEKSGWDKGAKPFDESELYGRECLAAFDIGRTDDLSVITYLFEPEEEGGQFTGLMRCFMPEEVVEKRSREHKVSYRQWIGEGLVIPTPGNATDTTEVLKVIKDDSELFKIQKISADISFALELINRLDVLGYPVHKFPQNYRTMNPAIIHFQKMIGKGQFRHGGNKVLSWMFSNVTLRKNTGGQVMMDKSDRITGKGRDHKKGRKKIDGMVSFAMNFGDYLDQIANKKKKPYQETGIRYL